MLRRLFRGVEVLQTLLALPSTVAFVVLIAGALVGLLSLIVQFELIAQIAILLAVCYFLLNGITVWRNRLRGCRSGRFQMDTPAWGHGLVLDLDGWQGHQLRDFKVVVRHGRDDSYQAPPPQHISREVGLDPVPSWFFPGEFHPKIEGPVPRGLYRVTWTALAPSGEIGSRRVVVAKDWFFVWPEGVFKSRDTTQPVEVVDIEVEDAE